MRKQHLSELNDTAALAWKVLAQGGSCATIAQTLQGLGASHEESAAYALSIVSAWLRAGYVAPLREELAPSLTRTLSLGLGPMASEVQFFGAADGGAAHAVFGHLARGRADTPLHIDILGYESEDVILVDGASDGLAPRTHTVPRLKALLTGRYCAAVDEGFLAHAGLVTAGGKSVLLAGDPGAGKTTLTLALCARGFSYGSDDIVHVCADGRVQGASFAAAVKRDAWPLLAPYWPRLERVEAHTRGDGKVVRYLLPEQREGGQRKPLDVVLLLARSAGREAMLARIEPQEALCALLASGYAERGRIEGETLDALAQDLSNGVCARLFYDGLNDAVALIERLIHE